MPREPYTYPERVAGVQNERGVQVYRPFETKSTHLDFQALPQVSPDQTKQLKPSDEDVSYVKIGGGSDIADWEACESLAGGFVITIPTGVSVDADFDRCMRARLQN